MPFRRLVSVIAISAFVGLLAFAPVASAQDDASRSVVLQPEAQQRQPLGVGDVGAELLAGDGRNFLRLTQAGAAVQQQEVTTAKFKRGALIGGGAGLAAGAVAGALLGGDRNARVETALPGALAGLAVGTPVGVYVQTGRSSHYLWGAAGAVGVAAAGTALLFAE